MCGRIVQDFTSADIAALFDAEIQADIADGRFNVAPTQLVLAVAAPEGQRVVTAFRWGLIPPWADSPRIGTTMINARAETVSSKPSFRASFRRQRCIVPATAYYEWQKQGSSKIPHAIRRSDDEPLALAGLWTTWRAKDADQTIHSCTIITTTPITAISPIHDRMPAILASDVWERWLDPDFSDADALLDILRPDPELALRAYPVSTAVNNVRNNGPELLTPLVAQTSPSEVRATARSIPNLTRRKER